MGLVPFTNCCNCWRQGCRCSAGMKRHHEGIQAICHGAAATRALDLNAELGILAKISQRVHVTDITGHEPIQCVCVCLHTFCLQDAEQS